MLICVLMYSCRTLYPDRLFQTGSGFHFFPPDSVVEKTYILKPDDRFSLAVFSNNGYSLVDVISSSQGNAYTALDFPVKENGYVKLPMLDSVKLVGLTVDDAEKLLQERYSYYFVNPFVRIEITNRRVYVYRGRDGAALVTLDKNHMNLLEVLAKSGGIPRGAKANKIRIIRGDLKHPQVLNIDLSTLSGMEAANLNVEANDIIYIESTITPTDVLAEFSPILTLLSTGLLVVTLVNTFQKL